MELVALQTMMPKIDSPVDVQTKALQLRQLQYAGQNADLDMQTKRQALADDQATREAYSSNPTDGKARLAALAGVSPKAYAAEAKAQGELAQKDALTQKAQLEVNKQKIDLAGQAFGYVRNYPTVENATRAVQWLGEKGVFTPEDVVKYTQQVQANPESIKGLADQAFANALAAKDHLMKVETRDTGGTIETIGTDPLTGKVSKLSSLAKTQTPDNIATNTRVAAEGKANRANQIEVQNMIGKRQDAKGDVEPSLNTETQLRIAKQFLRGDKSGLQNLGRGAQGAANIVAIQNMITDEGKRQGLTGEDIAGRMADFQGQTAGLRTANTISARIENAAAEAAQLAPLALAASDKVARSGFLPFGRAQVMFNNQTNDTAMNEFATANIGLATAYAGAMARGQKATVSDQEHAREMLSTAKSHEAYKSVVNQMLKEIEAAQRAPKQVREGLRGEVSGKGGGHAAPAPAAAAPIPAGWSVEVH